MPVKKSSARSHTPEKKKSHPRKKRTSVEDFVKKGVERFIMQEATIDEFLKTIRSVSKKGDAYTHQLTKSVFSKIVKQAIRKRKLQSGRA